MSQLKSQAIQTALVGDWENAININKQILQDEPDNIDTLNRLAFAYLSQGCTKDAKQIYEKVLSLDMKNPIALKNLKRLNDPTIRKVNLQLNNQFIEEPGKTKIIELINITDKKVFSSLRSGEKLTLCIKRMKIFALDQENQYIGMLPDDLCRRLIKFINGGNKYEAYARTVDGNKIAIFVRELKRVKRYKDQPSFVSTEKTKLSLENNSIPQKINSKSGKLQSNHNLSESEESL